MSVRGRIIIELCFTLLFFANVHFAGRAVTHHNASAAIWHCGGAAFCLVNLAILALGRQR